MTQFVIQLMNVKRGHWEEEAASFSSDEAFRLLREMKREYGPGMVRLIRQRL